MTVRIKICGITNSDDALAAVDAGADALGFIFVESTPRYVTPDRVAAMVAALPPFVTAVGVFWDHAPEHVQRVAELCRLHALQLHGQEPPEVVAGFDLPVLKTVKVAGPADLEPLDRYKPAAFLLDSPARWSEGEPRAPISWTLAREAGRRARVVLSAGLTAETVGAAIQVARPFGVDVNSGVEVTPGRKDPDKLRRFVRAARAADAALRDDG